MSAHSLEEEWARMMGVETPKAIEPLPEPGCKLCGRRGSQIHSNGMLQSFEWQGIGMSGACSLCRTKLYDEFVAQHPGELIPGGTLLLKRAIAKAIGGDLDELEES